MTVALSIRLLLFVHYMFLIKCNALLYFQLNNANGCHNVQFSFISELKLSKTTRYTPLAKVSVIIELPVIEYN